MDGHRKRFWDVDGIGERDEDGDEDEAGDRIWMGTGTGCARPHPVLGREVAQGPCNHFHVPQQSLWLQGPSLLSAWA